MKKAVVIGATSGIGKELARLLVADGYTVGITGRRAELLATLKNEHPSQYVTSSFDVSDTENVATYLASLVYELGSCQLLIISAGTGDINNELDFAIEKRTINTNINGFTAVADWAFNYFRQQGSGHLVAISSIAGLRGGRQAPAYNASKAYQISYLEALNQKARNLKSSIIITDIRPGFVETNMAKGEGMFWVAPPQKAATQIMGAIKGRARVAYITRRWALVAWLLKFLPRAIYQHLSDSEINKLALK